MDDSNLHTSVVIELANQENSEDQKCCKTDFDEMEVPKDYVIDQIFCGENITVYALFEVPEIRNEKSDGELPKIQNSTINNDSRFIHRNSFEKTVRENSKSFSKKLPAKDSYEDVHFAPKECSQSTSFYCLKHLGQNYEIPLREEGSADLKVLFSKDVVPKGSKQVKFKAVSKGVNTDIAQSPKIIEDIQRAINVGFSCEKRHEKAVEMTNVPSAKSSCEIDADMRQSVSSFSSDTESEKYRKKSSPNFLFVPLLMIEERCMSQFQKDIKIQALPEEKMLTTKTRITPTKMSLGTNTEVVDSSPMTSENEGRRESSRYASKFESPKIVESESIKRKEEEKENSNAKPHFKKKDKDTILNEIRKLQGKLNSLIKSIECNELSLSTDEDDRYSEMAKRTSGVAMKEFEKTSESELTDSESFRRNQNRFDDLPIFSPMTVVSPDKVKRVSPKKKTQNNSDREAKKNTSLDLVKSASSGLLRREEKISTIQSVCGPKKTEVKVENVFSGLNINWELKTGKGVGPSKSETMSRCNLPFPKYNCIKKSMSFDLRDDKIEMYGLKKIRNSSFKFEGSLKANMRIIQNGEVRLGENLTSFTREMGDEAKIKLWISKTKLQNFNEDPKKEEVIFLKNGAVDIKKSLNEEEGDAKLIYPNQNLASQKFAQDSEVHFCRPNAIASDALLKSLKMANPPRGKSNKIKKTEESGTKACSDTEKPTTPSRNHRKNSAVDSCLKKEVNLVKKPGAKSKILEKKSERKEMTGHEVGKPKSVSGSRKFTVKGTAESKLHVDKLIKAEYESKYDNANSQKAAKANTDDRSGGRTERLPRPCSQKRELRENPPETTATDRKETEKKIGKKKSDIVVETKPRPIRNTPDVEVKENVDRGKIKESNKEVVQESEQSPLENSAWLSSNSSSVVVELFSEKPTLEEEFYTEVNQERGNFADVLNGGCKSSESECQGKRIYGKQEKPIVKSIWALTKVLLYEDGTKKLEVLEASLTPPGYCLKSTTDEKPTENISE